MPKLRTGREGNQCRHKNTFIQEFSWNLPQFNHTPEEMGLFPKPLGVLFVCLFVDFSILFSIFSSQYEPARSQSVCKSLRVNISVWIRVREEGPWSILEGRFQAWRSGWMSPEDREEADELPLTVLHSASSCWQSSCVPGICRAWPAKWKRKFAIN